MIYRSPVHEPARAKAPPASLRRRIWASMRGLPDRLAMRRAWLTLSAEVRLELRRARLRRKLLRLGSPKLLEEATERVEAAWHYEEQMRIYHARWSVIDREGVLHPRPYLVPPIGSGKLRAPSEMQQAVACSATSVKEAIEALRAGLLRIVVRSIVRGRG